MKEEQNYIRDLKEMRSMMERSSKFLSLSGWAGVMAGIYALAGTYIAYTFLNFNPREIAYNSQAYDIRKVILLAITVLALAISTAVILSNRKAQKKKEKSWNITAKRLLTNMAIPLFAGGLLILILISKGLIGLLAPFTLIFYGLALYNAGKFTYEEIKSLGIIEIGLGLISSYKIEYGLIFWGLGFGIAHIIYGIYIHYKYER